MSDETARLVDQTADDLFAAESVAAREALAEGSWPEQLWQIFAETGLAQAALPEEAGGAGLAAGLAVLRAAGRHAAPIPVAETMIGTLLCHRAGAEVPDGPLTLYAPPTGALAARPVVQDGIDAATLPRVPWARIATVLAVGAPGHGLAFLTPSNVVEGVNLAGEPRDDVSVSGLPDLLVSLPPEVDGFALMALARAAQMRGAMEQVLAMSLRYAGERVQFGRPLKRFQAIQHYLAEIAGEAAATGAAVDAAAEARHPLRLRRCQGAGEPGGRVRSPASRIRCTAPSATPPSTICTIGPSGSGPGATSAATRPTGGRCSAPRPRGVAARRSGPRWSLLPAAR